MKTPHITITLDPHDGPYLPGEWISGEYHIATHDLREIKAIEVSALWYTMGKGDEDLAVHYFQRETLDEAAPDLVPTVHRFATPLPKSPLTYDGRIVKICWCIRVRLFLTRVREVVCDEPFQLGATPQPELAEAEAPPQRGEPI